MTDYDSGLRVIDVSVPSSPVQVGIYDTTNAYKVYVSGRYAYVVDYGSGLRVIDVSVPSSPVQTAIYGTTNAYGVYVSGRYAYVADSASGLRVIDISVPSSPAQAGRYGTVGALSVYVSGRYAYVGDSASGLRIIDVSVPSSPMQVGIYGTTTAYGVYVSGRYAYVADWTSGLRVIDISVPSSPVQAGIYGPTTGAWGVYVSGRYAYVADFGAGLRVVDIKGADVHALTAGTIETSTMTVNENMDVGNGLYVRNGINAGGSVATNGQFTAAGDVYFSGNVGIGVTTPKGALHVAGSLYVDTLNTVASGTNARWSPFTYQLGMDIAEFFEAAPPNTAGLQALSGTAVQSRIVNGKVNQDNAGLDSIADATLVALDPRGKAVTAQEGDLVLGARPMSPALVMEGSWMKIAPSFEDLHQPGRVPVALLGRVPVYLDGEVNPGDVVVAAGSGKVKRWKPGMRAAGYAGLVLETVNDKAIVLTGHQGLPRMINALQDELKELRRRMERNVLVDSSGNAALGATNPSVRLEVNGGFSLSPSEDMVEITRDGQVVEVGNRSYIRLQAAPSYTSYTAGLQERLQTRSEGTFSLSKPSVPGQVLILEWVGASNTAGLQERLQTRSGVPVSAAVRLSRDWPSAAHPEHSMLVLMSDGDEWAEMSRSE